MNPYEPHGKARTSRRLFLSAMPAIAVMAAACGSDQPTHTIEEIRAEAGPPPRPATPDEAIDALMKGNARFVAGRPQVRETSDIELLWKQIVDGQQPFAMVLGCADSRLAPELIFDQFVGDIFVVREAGNIAESPTNLGSLEFGQSALNAKALVVLGHSGCGAVKSAFDNATPGANIQAIVNAIKPGIAGARDVEDAVARNVHAVIDHLRKASGLLSAAEASGAFKIVGAVYDIKTATVRML